MNENTFRNNILKSGVSLRRKFVYNSIDYTDLLLENGISTIRRDINLSAGKATIRANNAGKWWNFLKDTNTALGDSARIQVYIDGDEGNILTLLDGHVERVRYPGSTVVLTIKDHAGDWLDKKVGSNKQYAVWYSAQSRFSDDLVWHMLTNEGELDATDTPANPDIDYASFAAWRDQHVRVYGYKLSGRPTGQTISTLLRKVCQMSHSYIWVNNDGKVAFAPPYQPGYSYDEENTRDRDLLIDKDKIINDVSVGRAYSYTQGDWMAYYGDTDATSIAKFGTFPLVVEDRILYHGPQASAESDRDATLSQYAYPLRFLTFKAGPPAIMEDVCNQITVSDSLKEITNAGAVIEEINYDLSNWVVDIRARWDW